MTLYASSSDIKAALRITDSVDDSLIAVAGSAASDLIDRHCERTFGTVSATRYFAPADNYLLPVDDLAGTAITVYSSTAANGTYDTTWTAADYQLEPSTSAGITVPYTRIRAVGNYLFPFADGENTVKITGVYGWPSVPRPLCRPRSFRRRDCSSGLIHRWVSPGVRHRCDARQPWAGPGRCAAGRAVQAHRRDSLRWRTMTSQPCTTTTGPTTDPRR